MIRVYLDWNVYSRIKTSNKDFYPELREILLENDKFCFPFSTVHLTDIYESYLKVGWSNIQGHLESLNLSKNLNIKQIFGQEIAFYISKPIDELKSYILERNPDEKFSVNEITNENDYIDYFPETTKFLKEQDEISETQDKLISSFSNLINSFLGVNVKEDYQKGMKISKGKLLAKKTNVIDYLNENSVKNGFTDFKSFNDDLLLKINKNPKFIDEIITLFATIDISGYGQDNAIFSSTITDSLHCAYASTCDIFIVDDVRTYLKSKEVYKVKNLIVKTFRPKEFIEYYKKHNIEFNSGKSIIDFAYNFPKQDEPIIKTETENIYYLENYLFDFFNTISINNLELEQPKIVKLYKLPAHNELCLLTSEKEDLLRKINSFFGEPKLIQDSWKENGILNSAWIYNEIELIQLEINYDEVNLLFIKCQKME